MLPLKEEEEEEEEESARCYRTNLVSTSNQIAAVYRCHGNARPNGTMDCVSNGLPKEDWL